MPHAALAHHPHPLQTVSPVKGSLSLLGDWRAFPGTKGVCPALEPDNQSALPLTPPEKAPPPTKEGPWLVDKHLSSLVPLWGMG